MENSRDSLMEFHRFFFRDLTASAQGTDSGAEQGFVDVNIADAGHLGLVEKDRLYRPARSFKKRYKPSAVKAGLMASGPRLS